ncbi:MAG: hypothetical protein GAK28_01246 [Luteibacter sp.]|uniref:GNAT family N-acetyltransferase n=1 Tax=Luteibacter sp. TaxID=1886636 RepID=UPI00137EFA72|nr:GNAT family N-acetyltransferase [Luteibacter sp.]KAF1008266.1 MAG: hypothetical protein GAK28_01246 [Luteibacter sp.]
MPITIRVATARDLPALRELFLRSRRDTFTWQPCHLFQLADFDVQTEGERILIAEEGMRLAGFVSVWEPDAFIHHLYVDGAFLRRGIARQLLNALPDWPLTRYRLKCLVRNLGALRFYEATGFVEVGRGTSDDGDFLLLESPRAEGAD